MFLMLSNHFNMPMSKIIFKKLKIYHRHIFYHEKLFKKSLYISTLPNKLLHFFISTIRAYI
jgi:ABC-type multidrug transport system permease subunit